MAFKPYLKTKTTPFMKNIVREKDGRYVSRHSMIIRIFIIWALVLALIVHIAYLRVTVGYYGEQVQVAHAQETIDDRLGELLPSSTVIVTNNVEWTRMEAPRLSDVSAYTSRVQETDASPCVGADGTNMCDRFKKGEKMVASNCHKLGSKLKIGNLGEFTVTDRMNKRYTPSCRVDIYMGYDLQKALKFGVKKLMVTEL